MRRLAAIALALAAGIVAVAGSAAGGSQDTYRVDAIFDNAANLVPGQDVKIAGATVGRVSDLELTPDHRARVQMEIDGRFAPFRSDGDCTVQPQSLIGEKFIQCAPGTPRGRELTGRGGAAPTLPVANTHSPVDLDLVFATFRLPVRQRLTILLSELGVGVAARGDDLNAAIRRAAPALGETNRVLAILDRDRARLGTLVGESDAIIAELAGRREGVGRFIDTAAAVTRRTAARRAELRATVRGLPPLLTEARPTLRRLTELTRAGTPVLADLERAAPQVDRLVADLGPLADAARPTLDRIGEAAETGTRAVRAGRPVVARLRTFARQARPVGALVAQLFDSMRRRGVVEGLQSFVYNAALATSRYDQVSHTLPAHLITSECQQYTAVPVAGCSAHFGAAPGPVAQGASRAAPRGRAPVVRTPAAVAPVPAVTPQAPSAPAAPPRRSPLPALPLVDPAVGQAVDDLLGFLLG